jgi:hypothetical protein
MKTETGRNPAFHLLEYLPADRSFDTHQLIYSTGAQYVSGSLDDLLPQSTSKPFSHIKHFFKRVQFLQYNTPGEKQAAFV